jgi:hypothetical protein
MRTLFLPGIVGERGASSRDTVKEESRWSLRMRGEGGPAGLGLSGLSIGPGRSRDRPAYEIRHPSPQAIAPQPPSPSCVLTTATRKAG